MAPGCLLFVSVALALLCVAPLRVSSQDYDIALAADYTCPPGFIPIQRGASGPVECDADQCYNEVVGCGPGKSRLITHLGQLPKGALVKTYRQRLYQEIDPPCM